MPERPNIVMFTTDHQRYDCMGVNGNPVIRTPTLGRLLGCTMHMEDDLERTSVY